MDIERFVWTDHARMRSYASTRCERCRAGHLRTVFAYYDRDADIAWFPTGESTDVVSERVPGGLRDYDRASHRRVAIEVWDASTRLPASIPESRPAPVAPQSTAA